MLDLSNNEFMESPFSENENLTDSEKLGQYLSYTLTPAQPFNAEFITSLLNFSNFVASFRSTPATLLDSFEAVSQLDLMLELMQQERSRLTQVYREYISLKEQILAKYTPSEIEEWLKENPVTLPEATS